VGALAYHGGAGTSRLVWFDRSGAEIGTIGSPGAYGSVRISPFGNQVAVEVVDPRSGTSDVWVHDVSRKTSIRLTYDLGSEADPVWSPDGRQVVFRSDRDGPPDLHRKSSNGLAPAEILLTKAGVQRPTDWSADGRMLTFTEEDRETGHSLWVLALDNEQPRRVLRTRFQEGNATFSPDGRWLAFVSDESGRPEVYVAPAAGDGGMRRISNSGGFTPRWRRDGKELFYLEPDSRFMSVPVGTRGDNFEAGAPVQLFRVASPVAFTRRTWYASYDVSPDGQRFLVNAVVDDAASAPITIVLNWQSALKKN
jgi:Tol biopolymer transport system component